jgi:tryptophan synthase alpha subunit
MNYEEFLALKQTENPDLFFEIFSTFTGNRTTASIVRLADGTKKDVHIVLKSEERPMWQEKIEAAIKQVKKTQINETQKIWIDTYEKLYQQSRKEVVKGLLESIFFMSKDTVEDRIKKDTEQLQKLLQKKNYD